MEQNVILLRKNLGPTSDDVSSWIDTGYSHWISFGHFDEIFIYSLKQEQDFFSNIYTDKRRTAKHCNADFYYHPLYLVPDSGNVALDHDQRNFIAVVRIHFSLSQMLSTQFITLKETLHQAFTCKGMSYLIHHATEFSDMVLDIRSNNFSELLNVVLTLRKNKEIGKMYTYFGINVSCLSSKNDLDSADVIPLLSMRFSGTDLSTVKEQIELVQSKLPNGDEFAVNGVDDVLLQYRNLPTEKMIALYRDWLFNEEYRAIRLSESTTRVGIRISVASDFETPPPSDLPPLCSKLISLCGRISLYFDQIRDYIDDSWFYAISEIANSLARMSRSPVMDEVVYLLAPGVESFLENIQFRLNTHSFDPANLPIYYEFVEHCTYLLEQLTRIEGQLSQQPELRPPIFDIPVFMLEYTIAFLNKVSTLLRQNDGDQIMHHVFLFIPHPCELISAKEIFCASSNLPGLVQLQVPIKILYTPTKILSALCHEISHYVGETYRNRKSRKEFYARATAVIFSDAFFQSKNIDFISFVEESFLKNLNCKDAPTVQEMREIITDSSSNIMESDAGLTRFLRDSMQFSANGIYISFPTKEQITLGKQHFLKKCNDLDILFREVYADICMLHILELPSDEYIESLLEELEKNATTESSSPECFAARIYVSLTAMGKAPIYHRSTYCDTWSTVLKHLNHIECEIREGTDGQFSFSLPISSVYALLEYAVICYDTIRTAVDRDSTNSVREMYSCLTKKEFSYSLIMEKIEECRCEMSSLASKKEDQ